MQKKKLVIVGALIVLMMSFVFAAYLFGYTKSVGLVIMGGEEPLTIDMELADVLTLDVSTDTLVEDTLQIFNHNADVNMTYTLGVDYVGLDPACDGEDDSRIILAKGVVYLTDGDTFIMDAGLNPFTFKVIADAGGLTCPADINATITMTPTA